MMHTKMSYDVQTVKISPLNMYWRDEKRKKDKETSLWQNVLIQTICTVGTQMDFILCGLSYIISLVYLNDEHLVQLWDLFSQIRHANLKLKRPKCSLSCQSVYFSDVLPKAVISMQTEKVQVIRDWPSCRSLTELRAFLDRCQRFVKDYCSSSLQSLRKEFNSNDLPNASTHSMCWNHGVRMMIKPTLALPNDEETYALVKGLWRTIAAPLRSL